MALPAVGFYRLEARGLEVRGVVLRAAAPGMYLRAVVYAQLLGRRDRARGMHVQLMAGSEVVAHAPMRGLRTGAAMERWLAEHGVRPSLGDGR